MAKPKAASATSASADDVDMAVPDTAYKRAKHRRQRKLEPDDPAIPTDADDMPEPGAIAGLPKVDIRVMAGTAGLMLFPMLSLPPPLPLISLSLLLWGVLPRLCLPKRFWPKPAGVLLFTACAVHLADRAGYEFRGLAGMLGGPAPTPEAADGYMAKGWALTKGGKHEAAVSEFKRAAAIVADSPLPWVAIAQATALGRQYDDCLAAASHALELNRATPEESDTTDQVGVHSYYYMYHCLMRERRYGSAYRMLSMFSSHRRRMKAAEAHHAEFHKILAKRQAFYIADPSSARREPRTFVDADFKECVAAPLLLLLLEVGDCYSS